jgi:phospholipase D1/2
MIVDDDILHLGSSNLNNRSMGFDTECDIALTGPARLIESFRSRLVSEHLGVDADRFNQTVGQQTSLIGAVETLNSAEGRRLCPLGKRPDSLTSHILAETQFMDPRFGHGDEASAGQGVRPRHIFLTGIIGVLGYLGWRSFFKRK